MSIVRQGAQTVVTAFLAMVGLYTGFKVCEYVDENRDEVKGKAQGAWKALSGKLQTNKKDTPDEA